MKQKYLAQLSSFYGLTSEKVEASIIKEIRGLTMRIYAINAVYQSKGNLTAGVDGVTLTADLRLEFLKKLSFKLLLIKYKASPIRHVLIPKGSGKLRPLGIPTIMDRVVQTFVTAALDPVIDVYSDKYSFGFRKGRNAHQAIGELSRTLYQKPANRRAKHKPGSRAYFSHRKYVLITDVKGFFDNVSHDWLLDNYPMPRLLKGVLYQWLKAEISYQGKAELNLTGFLQGSVIGPSLANFTLNGLEQCIKPTQKTTLDEMRYEHYNKLGKDVKRSKIRMEIRNRIIRYADDFVIVCNHEKESIRIKGKIEEFLAIRGLKVNEGKSFRVTWKHGAKFNYLGFTLHYLINTFPSRVTEQRTAKSLHITRGGLYVYPSNESIKSFKRKIRTTINSNLNLSPYKLIKLINPIIRG